MTADQAIIARQFALEEEMRTGGIARYRKNLAKAKANRSETEMPAGMTMLQDAVGGMSTLVTEFFTAAATGAGRRHTAIKYLSSLEADVVAFITSKAVLDGVTQAIQMQSLAVQIGRNLEDETWFRAFAKQKPWLYNGIVKAMAAENIGAQQQAARLRRTTRKYEIAVDAWDKATCFKVGAKCLDLFILATGAVELVTVGGKKDRKVMVRPTEAILKWIEEADGYFELLAPDFMPMLVPPLDWTDPKNGGYLTNKFRRRPLVKHPNEAYQDTLAATEMPAVYSAVNALQRTAWQINGDVLAVLKVLWSSQAQTAKLPSIREDEVPPFPSNPEDKDAVDGWRKMARSIREGNTKRKSRRIALAKTLYIAEKFKDETAIYYPHYLCFRGRAYPRPLFLTPQGGDAAKGLLRFAEGMPLGDQGACWLAIHGANLWGFDKVDLQARIDWAAEFEAQILASAKDPLDFLWWAGADKPFQFLAFCFEWAGYLREGPGFVSRLPVALDGSCNGLQNFSMALRDLEGGKAVNLVPAPKPADIYQEVANKVLAKVQAVASGGSEQERAIATLWLASGYVGRKLCKQPVMTLPYGASQYGMRQSIVDFIVGQREEGAKDGFGDQLFVAATFIGKIVWTSIEETVIAARHIMTWLRKIALLAAAEDKPISWTVPSGFPVLQEYRETVAKEIKTALSKGTIWAELRMDTNKLDRRRQGSGMSPNWVHSLDASHMMLTVNTGLANGIEAFAMIHDSFGTHAAKAELLGACLRSAFVEQYRHDVVQDLWEAVATTVGQVKAAELPLPPQKGLLDVEQVLQSEFFFA